MKYDLRYGKIKYVGFIVLDIICLVLSNTAAYYIYNHFSTAPYKYERHIEVIWYMVIADLFVTIVFNTLYLTLRRNLKREIIETAKHVAFSFVALSLILFSVKQGADYSRITIYLVYIIDFFLLLASREMAKIVLKRILEGRRVGSSLLVTTEGFAEEGIEEMRHTGRNVRQVLLLREGKKNISGVITTDDVKTALAIFCWENTERVYIYGIDYYTLPEILVSSLKDMNVSIDTVRIEYKVIDVKTINADNAEYGSLSFLEGKKDIPFPIRRVYWITETEASLHRGFHAHKANCQLLFCPYGEIDIILDDGKTKDTVKLDEPSKGLLLMPGLWREMVWIKSESVLCVLASEYYDPEEYIRNYDDFIAYKKGFK